MKPFSNCEKPGGVFMLPCRLLRPVNRTLGRRTLRGTLSGATGMVVRKSGTREACLSMYAERRNGEPPGWRRLARCGQHRPARLRRI